MYAVAGPPQTLGLPACALIGGVTGLGLTAERLFELAELAPSALAAYRAGQRVSVEDDVALWRAADLALDDPILGLRLAAGVPFGAPIR